MKIIEVSQFFIQIFYFLHKRVYTLFLNVAVTLFVYMSVWSTGIHDRLKRMMKLKRFLLYNGFNKLQNNLLVPSYCPKNARTLRLVLSDNPTVMVLFMLLRICDLNYRILSHHLYISKNKNKKTHCACKWSSILTQFMKNDLMIIQETVITTWCVLNAMTNNSNSTNNIQILVDATSKIFFYFVYQVLWSAFI